MGAPGDESESGDLLAELTSPAVRRFLEEHEGEDPRDLALRFSGKVDFDLRAAVEQIALRRKAAEKLPSWKAAGCLYTRRALEQSTGEELARWRAERFGGGRLVDGTAGLGVDAWALSGSFEEVIAVERDPLLTELLAHNKDRLGVPSVAIVRGEIESWLRAEGARVDSVFLDPDRRPDGARVAAIEVCRPDVSALMPLLARRADRVLLKLSPLVDPRSVPSTLPGVVAVSVVSVRDEVKEVLVEARPGGSSDSLRIEAVDLAAGGPRVVRAEWGESDDPPLATPTEGSWLHEAGRAVIHAGLARRHAAELGLVALHPRAPVFVGERSVDGFVGSARRILRVCAYRPKALRKELRALGVERAQVARREFPRSPEQIRADLRVPPGDDARLVCVTLASGELACLVCAPRVD